MNFFFRKKRDIVLNNKSEHLYLFLKLFFINVGKFVILEGAKLIVIWTIFKHYEGPEMSGSSTLTLLNNTEYFWEKVGV